MHMGSTLVVGCQRMSARKVECQWVLCFARRTCSVLRMTSPTAVAVKIPLYRNDALAVVTLTFERIGPVPSSRSRKAALTIAPVTVRPPAFHKVRADKSRRDVDATAGYVTEIIRRQVRMHLDAPRFTVSVDLDSDGTGTFLIDGGRNGHGTIASTA